MHSTRDDDAGLAHRALALTYHTTHNDTLAGVQGRRLLLPDVRHGPRHVAPGRHQRQGSDALFDRPHGPAGAGQEDTARLHPCGGQGLGADVCGQGVYEGRRGEF